MQLAHPKFTYTHGLHELGAAPAGGNNSAAFAWLQPDGGWGWSNSGLITCGDQSLIVDTLFDVPLTQTMLAAYKDANPAAQDINKIINTHHNGDHCNGNCCCADAQIIAHRATAKGMAEEPPALVQGFLDAAPDLGELGKYLTSCFGPFDFKSVTQKMPDTLFDKDYTAKVGDVEVQCIHVGPAHTAGDTLVYVPSQKIIYTGDILFIGGHPIIWDGPVQNWIDACDKILSLDVDIIVPGHGPITTKEGVQAVRDYLTTLKREAKIRYDAGMNYLDAAFDIALGVYDEWGDRERVVINCATIYRELGAQERPEIAELFSGMSQYVAHRTQND